MIDIDWSMMCERHKWWQLVIGMNWRDLPEALLDEMI
jgi:hypothetical protein